MKNVKNVNIQIILAYNNRALDQAENIQAHINKHVLDPLLGEECTLLSIANGGVYMAEIWVSPVRASEICLALAKESFMQD